MNKLITECPNVILIIGLVIAAEVIAIVFIIRWKKKRIKKQPVAAEKEEHPEAVVYSETVAVLERSDVNELTNSLSGSFFIVLMITVIAWAVLYFLIDAGVLGYGIFTFIMSLFWVGLIKGRYDFLRIIREGKKIIMKGTIAERIEIIKESGDSTDYTYYLRIGEQQLQVQDHIYKRYAKGQVVEFHFVRNRGGFPILLKDKLIAASDVS